MAQGRFNSCTKTVVLVLLVEWGSSPWHHLLFNAPVAQLVEHLIEDQGVGGSNPSGSTIIFFAGISRVNTLYYYAAVAELVDALVLGTSIVRCGGSSPFSRTKNRKKSLV